MGTARDIHDRARDALEAAGITVHDTDADSAGTASAGLQIDPERRVLLHLDRSPNALKASAEAAVTALHDAGLRLTEVGQKSGSGDEAAILAERMAQVVSAS